ncbi:EamA family transporter [Phenylobacterium sp.]|uniref:DMT family transporter n=1 Tax=Phenylobacterium sp. TaxID=1871053 RepID=UPI00086E4CFA|nr:MAG: hypothetical protein ABS77_12680 [Phenylobacterium sp. SCN 69-14]
MPLSVFAIVLLAALLHASWNAIVKGASDKLLTTVLVAAGSAVIAIAALPFLPQPSLASWPYLGVSAVLQLGAYLLLARAYRGADMSQIYPLMRGTAPLLVALVGTFALGDHLAPAGWIGVALICGGVLSLALGARQADMAGVRLALPSALVIAAYTLIDGVGVRLSQAAIAYNLWLCLLTGAPLLAWALARRGPEFLAYARANAVYGAVGGFGTLAAYGLALWAMTKAPVAAVAALRETSILFAAAIAAIFLRETLTPLRLLACAVIALGAATLRLA